MVTLNDYNEIQLGRLCIELGIGINLLWNKQQLIDIIIEHGKMLIGMQEQVERDLINYSKELSRWCDD